MVVVAPVRKQSSNEKANHLWIVGLVLLAGGFVWIFSSSLLLRTQNIKLRASRLGGVLENVVVDTIRDDPMVLSAKGILKSGRPYLLYGTAWKKDDTASLVSQAIHLGFRFIDTACQPKHYNEAGVGEGWTSAASELGLERSDIFLQTKFTSINGQDPSNIPYDKGATLEKQVEQSIEKSLYNLRTDYIDSLVLHSPMKTMDDTLRVWKVFESFVADGKVRQLGISNCYKFQDFQRLYEETTIKPAVLQNRFYEQTKYDIKLREMCNNNKIRYQSFWTLTAPGNRNAMNSPAWKVIANEKGLTPQTLMYAYMMSLGHTPLDGSKDTNHMKEDIDLMMRFQTGEDVLAEAEIETLSDLLKIQS